ncbi:MAG: PEGA domain-containing protein, partial [Myxococcota bacterium]
MSPEQARGKPLDARSDLFSLGVVMFEMTTGRRLFKRETELQTVQAVCNDPIPNPKIVVPDYPDELFRICQKALAREPADRYQSALELRRDLLAFMHADRTAPLPEELIAVFMQDMFEDRIEMKRGLLQRVRKGERFETFASATDSIIEVSALLPGTLPSSSAKAHASHAPVSMLQDADITVTPLPQRFWRSWPALALVSLMTMLGVVGIVVGSGSRRPPAAQKDTVSLEFASEPSGAAVVVDGRSVGQTPLKLTLPRSSRPVAVTLRHAGYAPWTTVLKPNRDVLVKGHLTVNRVDAGRPLAP